MLFRSTTNGSAFAKKDSRTPFRLHRNKINPTKVYYKFSAAILLFVLNSNCRRRSFVSCLTTMMIRQIFEIVSHFHYLGLLCRVSTSCVELLIAQIIDV